MPKTLGKYQIGRTLGRGVSCKVKLARTLNGSRYAIKILNDDPEIKDLMQIEVGVLKKLHHDNIINLIEIGRDTLKKDQKIIKQVDYIVLELA